MTNVNLLLAAVAFFSRFGSAQLYNPCSLFIFDVVSYILHLLTSIDGMLRIAKYVYFECINLFGSLNLQTNSRICIVHGVRAPPKENPNRLVPKYEAMDGKPIGQNFNKCDQRHPRLTQSVYRMGPTGNSPQFIRRNGVNLWFSEEPFCLLAIF